jgi:hypothetical protein
MGLGALKHPDSLRPDALQTIFGTDRRENYPMNFQEQINTIWQVAQQCLRETGAHQPQLITTSPDGHLSVITIVLPAGVRPRDVLPDILRMAPVKQFIFISEAWGLTHDKNQLRGHVQPGESYDDAAKRLRASLPANLEDCPDREEILMQIAVSRDYQDMRTIAFEHTADGAIAFPRPAVITHSTDPGARLVGAFINMKDVLELLN